MSLALFAQQQQPPPFNPQQLQQLGDAAGSIMMYLMIFGAVMFVFTIIMIASMWAVFSKAGKPGWACIIPIYNVIVILEIAGKPLWWFLLMLIPLVNIIIILIVLLDVARNFGKGAGFGIGLFLFGFIFWPILGFGSAQYIGNDLRGDGASRRRSRDDDYDDEDDDDRPRRRRSSRD